MKWAQIFSVVKKVLQHVLHSFILREMLKKNLSDIVIISPNHFILTWQNTSQVTFRKSSAYAWQYNFFKSNRNFLVFFGDTSNFISRLQ